tara:strand:- start:3120 stop:4628 length:1509 start_codon:yes stop_codon:yes gene_type:complete
MGRAALTRNIAFGIVVVSSLVTVPWIIQVLGGHWYGIWVIVGTLMGYFGVLDFGLVSATVRFLGTNWAEDKQAEIGRVLSTSVYGLFLLSAVALLICAAAWLYAPLLLANSDNIPMLRTVILIIGLNIAISLPASVFQAVLTVQLRYDLIAIATGLQAAIRIGLIYAVLRFGGTIVEIALVTLALNLFAYLLHFAFSIRSLPPGTFSVRNVSNAQLFSLIDFGRFTFLTSIGDILRFRVDVLVIGAAMTSAAAGIYNIGLVLHNMAANVVANIVGGTQPLFAGYYAEDRIDLIREKLLLITRFSTALCCMASGTLIMLAPSFIDIWVGPDFTGAVWPLIILAIVMPLGLSQNAAVQVLYAIAKHRYNAYLTICEAVANVLLSVLLVQYFGLIGIALGTAIPIFVTKTVFLPRYVCTNIDLSIVSYFGAMVLPALKVGVLQAPCAALLILSGIDGFWQMLPVVMCWQLFAGAVLIRFLISEEDYTYISDAVPYVSILRRRKAA